MQNLSTSQIIELIENEVCFEATHNGNYYIKIQEYVPSLCAAIHDGHQLREELEKNCLLTEDERYYEEDPYTGEFIRSLPITLIGGDSRYEYDLNRSPKGCVYTEAWGKKVWNQDLTESQINQSINKHLDFYKVAHALVKKLETKFGACIVFDIHSYNHQRHDETHLFNLGIENINTIKYNQVISQWKKSLASIKVKKVLNTVSVNHLFYGRGYFLEYITSNFDNTLVLATEVKKVFMDELSGQEFPIVVQSIAKGLKTAILDTSKYFINNEAKVNINKRSKLLKSDIHPVLLKLDKKLFQLLKNFELLSFVNPTNLEQEKRRFIKEKYNYNPSFKYKPLTIDPHVFKSKLYQLDVDLIEDIHVRQLYIDIISSYADKVDMLSTLGTEKFLYNSLRYFGEPSETDLANSNFLLYCNELNQYVDEEFLPLNDVKQLFLDEGEKYGFEFNIEVSDKIPSDALVINSKKKVVLKKGALFTQTRVKALLHHEIGVHMVTTMNALDQPLKMLSLGLPQNTYTQEGLAILAELNSGNLTVARLHELALRVKAVKSLANGFDFKYTYQKLLESYNVNPNKLFYLVARVYRGGGFTKDYLYLRGFRRLLQLTDKGVNIDNLLLGKTNHKYLVVLNEMVDRGFLNKPKYDCEVLKKPHSIDPTLKYISDCIK